MQLRFEIKDSLGWIILENPPHNSLTHPVFADKNQLLSFLNNPQIKGVIVRGSGRHFSSGADPETFSKLFSSPRKFEALLNQAKELLNIINSSTIPTVAVICGSCLGAGLEIAAACHFRFASESAMLGFPETSHSLLPGLGGSVTGGKLMGKNNLIDLILSGRMIRAKEGQEIGLIDSVGPTKKTEEMAMQYLSMLTANHSTDLIRTVMQSIHNSSQMSERDALLAESKLFCKLAKELTLKKQG